MKENTKKNDVERNYKKYSMGKLRDTRKGITEKDGMEGITKKIIWSDLQIKDAVEGITKNKIWREL